MSANYRFRLLLFVFCAVIYSYTCSKALSSIKMRHKFDYGRLNVHHSEYTHKKINKFLFYFFVKSQKMKQPRIWSSPFYDLFSQLNNNNQRTTRRRKEKKTLLRSGKWFPFFRFFSYSVSLKFLLFCAFFRGGIEVINFSFSAILHTKCLMKSFFLFLYFLLLDVKYIFVKRFSFVSSIIEFSG